jgi:NfeD-like.
MVFFIFLGCAIVGSIILLIGVLTDGAFDFDGGGLSAFGVFIAAFGAAGLLMPKDNNNPVWYISFSAGIAIAVAVLFVFVMRVLRKQGEGEVNETPEWTDAIGKQVSVVHWKDDRGEVLVTHAGSTHRMPAKSLKPIESPSIVVVQNILGDHTVLVASVDGR